MRRFRAPRLDRRGAAAIEFVIVAPVLLAMFAGVVDIGNLLITRFRLNAAVASGVNYSMVHSEDVGTDGAPGLSTSLARLVANSSQTSGVTATVTVNNGPSATAVGSGAATVSSNGTPATSNALCYCPTTGSDWAITSTCGNSCTGGGTAGRFVRITARKTFTPLLSTYGLVRNGTVVATNIVQTE